MEGFINLKEKVSRLRFFFEKIRYSREKHLYLTLFLIIIIIAAVSFSIFIYQKRQVNMRENMLSGYYEELLKSQNGKSADNRNEGVDRDNDPKEPGTQSQNSDQALIKVYICGSINNPGVYEIENGARIADLLQLCGGANDNAALEAVNLAFILHDASMVYIPSIEEIEEKGISFYDFNSGYGSNMEGSTSLSSSKGPAGIVNINTAGIEELMQLPGIGEKTAGNIIEYRNSFGYFKKPEELKNVKGIGEKKFEAVKDMISV